MPQRKKVPSLKDLCIGNITRNIVSHAERMEKWRTEGGNYIIYKVLESLFTDAMLKSLPVILNEERLDKKFTFIGYTFPRHMRNGVENWAYLEFFFNEYTACLLPVVDIGSGLVIPNEVLSYIFSKCKNLRRLNMEFWYEDVRFLELIPEFKNLREVNLGMSADNHIVAAILTNCLLITKLSVFDDSGSAAFSDKGLFALCKHHSGGEKFTFCPENGACSEAGKRLRILDIVVSSTTKEGMACALQHLPRLEEMGELPPYVFYLSDPFHKVVKGIELLRDAAAANGRPPLILQFKKFFFGITLNLGELQAVLACCPKLEALQLDLHFVTTQVLAESPLPRLKELSLTGTTNSAALNSTQLNSFLPTRGKEIETLTFSNRFGDMVELDLMHINNILNMCCSLKKLSLWEFPVSDRIFDTPQSFPSCFSALEEIDIGLYGYCSPSCRQYFYELLCIATSVKSLSVYDGVAEQSFSKAMGINGFRKLEELYIKQANIAKIPLEKLLNSNNNIRKIVFHDCLNLDVALYEDIARKNNYELEITESCIRYNFVLNVT